MSDPIPKDNVGTLWGGPILLGDDASANIAVLLETLELHFFKILIAHDCEGRAA